MEVPVAGVMEMLLVEAIADYLIPEVGLAAVV